MNSTNLCESCGTERDVDSSGLEGLCPSCLLARAFPELAKRNSAEESNANFHPPTVDEVAKIFDKLEILELIGKGGMSAVYKAKQTHLDRVVALKLLSEELVTSAEDVARFHREAKTLAQLSHPNIVGLYDAGTLDGWCYILMEYVDGPNLRQLIGDSHLSNAEVLRIVPDICRGLQFAHDHGVLHQDIKPENILIDKSGNAKLADFGIAACTYDLDSQRESSQPASHVLGTPAYLSPEQIQSPNDVDHRADLYAVGVVVYEMLNGGELPNNPGDPLDASGPHGGPTAVIQKVLAKDRRRRHNTADE